MSNAREKKTNKQTWAQCVDIRHCGSLSSCKEKGSVVLRLAVGTWLDDSVKSFVIR